MKCRFINVLAFAIGAAVGSVVTWKVLEKKYDKIVQEELESIRDRFGSEEDGTDEKCEDADDSEEGRSSSHRQINWADLEDLNEDEDDDKSEYERLTQNYSSEKGGAELKEASQPYVIAPEDFGEIDDYKQFELTYYADGILEDEEYNIIKDYEGLIGRDSLYTFGEYEDDSVFVRNDAIKADFQILKDYRTYEVARGVSPNQVDHE
jgi:hypothetical protein